MDSNLRNFGSLMSVDKLISSSTGEDDINPAIFVSYLENKYLG